MKRGAIGQDPKNPKAEPHPDPLQRAIESAQSDFWTLRPPKDIRRMVALAIQHEGRDKGFWTWACIRAGLSKKYKNRRESLSLKKGEA